MPAVPSVTAADAQCSNAVCSCCRPGSSPTWRQPTAPCCRRSARPSAPRTASFRRRRRSRRRRLARRRCRPPRRPRLGSPIPTTCRPRPPPPRPVPQLQCQSSRAADLSTSDSISWLGRHPLLSASSIGELRCWKRVLAVPFCRLGGSSVSSPPARAWFYFDLVDVSSMSASCL